MVGIRDISDRKQVDQTLDRQLRFERLLSELSAAFVNLPADRVDSKIEYWLQRVTELIGADRASVLEFTSEGAGKATHSYDAPGIPEFVSVSLDVVPYFAGQLSQGN